MDDNGSEEPIDTDTTELDQVKKIVHDVAAEDDIPLHEDWEERLDKAWPEIKERGADALPHVVDPAAVERLKAFMRNPTQGRIEEGFSPEVMAAAAQEYADEMNGVAGEVWPGTVKPADPYPERYRRSDGLPTDPDVRRRMGQDVQRIIGTPSGDLGYKRGIVRGAKLREDMRDLPPSTDVDVNISRRAGEQDWMVESDVLSQPAIVKTSAIPLGAMVGMANASPKPDGIRPIMVPEARLDMVKTAYTMWQADLYPDHPDYSGKAMEWVARTMMDADLYWVSSEMSQLLQHAAPALPPTTLTDDLLPSECGVVFFADPLMGQDAQSADHQIWVSALLWGPCQFDVTDTMRLDGAIVEGPENAIGGPTAVVDMADIENDPDFVQNHNLQPGQSVRFRGNGVSISTWRKWEQWVPLGRTDWPMGFDTEGAFAPPNYTDVQLASIIEDRRWLAAFAILSQQTSITRIRTVDTDRHAAKRLKRRGHAVPKVRLVDINPPKPIHTGETRDVHWTKRWLVRGHWRQQAYGPGRQYRRPVYINSFIKGPENKPLEVSPEVVKVWRR